MRSWRTLLLLSIGVVGRAGTGAGAETIAPASQPDGQREATVQAVATDINEFTRRLYAQLREQPGSVICSPFSASTALAMVLAGARGETEQQLASALCQQLPSRQLHSPYGALLDSLRGRNQAPGIELSAANRVWVQSGLAVQAEFRALLTGDYGSELGMVDFRGQPEPARLAVNRWVAQQTHERIADLIAPGAFDDRTRLVLVNAVYFLGTWQHTFREERTHDGPFVLADGQRVEVPMMRQTASLRLAEAGDLQLLELPYQGGQLAMLIALPRAPGGLDAVERELVGTADERGFAAWERSLTSASAREVDVMLPRFRLQSQFDLVPPLRRLGIERAFTDQADFSGVSPARLAIAAVVQKACVEVGERGTEAAAATGVTMGLTSAGPPPAAFHADHPFLFLIRDRPTGAVLFLGRVADPRP